MKAAIIADSGGLLRAIACDSGGRILWPEYEQVLRSATIVVVPDLVLAEIDYLLRHQRDVMRKLVGEILDPAMTFELEPMRATDLARAMDIDGKFDTLGLGLVDGMVAAIAERRGIDHVLTTDRKHFSVIRVGRRYERALTLVP